VRLTMQCQFCDVLGQCVVIGVGEGVDSGVCIGTSV
jgi:hypothetical protein